ncbi:transcriptional regulator [Mucilaginibacter litoreus]|uniref:Transcriptional regulator n=1 Tax=Mucilaginibacter litoreus TaxID=1048221 RepID=A0ABW3AXL3_9SPHI
MFAFIFVLLFGAFPAIAQSLQHPFYQPGLFASLKDPSENSRVKAARSIYKSNCRKMNRADAMHSLHDLIRLATKLNDKGLQCAVYDMCADYYSVNRGYNQLSNQYYDQAIAFAQKQNMRMEAGIYQHRKANYLFLYKKNTEACRYYLLSEENLREVGFSKVPDIGNLFSETANFYYAVGDEDNARENLRYALKYQPEPSRTRVNIINTLGLSYRSAKEYKPAIKCFYSALSQAQQIGDSVWAAIAKGNIGSVYFLQQNYAKALPLIREDYQQSVKYKQVLNSGIALLRLVQINIKYNLFQEASLQLDTAYSILSHTGENALIEWVHYYELKAIVNEHTGNFSQASKYHNVAESLRDSVDKRDNIAAIDRVKMQWIKEKSHQEFNALRKAAENAAFKQNAIIIVLLLILIIIILIYNRQNLKAKKDKELLASEKLRLDAELENAIDALHGYTENLREKNSIIEQFKIEIERLKSPSDTVEIMANLEKMVQAHIMTEENWTEFKKLFSRAHNSFLYNLRQYDGLSTTDTRLLTLIKLKLNNREMAGMLGITIDGVKKAKQRLRKKLNLFSDEEIGKFVNNL